MHGGGSRNAAILAILAAATAVACGGGRDDGDVPLVVIPIGEDVLHGVDIVYAGVDGAPEAVADPGADPAGGDVPGATDPGTDDAAAADPDDPGDPGDPGAATDVADPGVPTDPAHEPGLPDLAADETDDADDASPDVAEVTPPPTGLGKAGVIYVHTSSTLYAWDGHVAAPLRIADFKWPSDGGGHQMTDIALDRQGHLFGITFDALYQCNAQTAACIHLADNPSDFNGLTFVPKGTIQATAETMIAISLDGGWYRVDVANGRATLTKLGSYGSSYTSAGDAYSLESRGTFAAVKDSDGMNLLVQVDPTNGSIVKQLGAVAGQNVYGLAGIGPMIYAFDESGAVYSGDVASGTFQQVIAPNSNTPWWGAGVSTRDPGSVGL